MSILTKATNWGQQILSQNGMTYANGNITVPVPGLYSVTAEISWFPPNLVCQGCINCHHEAYIVVNDDTQNPVAHCDIPATTFCELAYIIKADVPLNADDYVSIYVSQNTGFDLLLGLIPSPQVPIFSAPRFSVYRIGSATCE
jgi:hypothetical protein